MTDSSNVLESPVAREETTLTSLAEPLTSDDSWHRQTYDTVTLFQLDIFRRVLRPARTVLRPARIIYLKKIYIFSIFYIFFFLQNVIAVFVSSDSRCKNACNCLQICVHVFINRPQNCAHADLVSFACWIVTEF